jgi:glyoxylase-like metal-dependent hydrolase (beta-lactamase superfamily II)
MIGWASLLRSDEVSIGTATRVIQFRREARGCFSYLLVSGAEALVVDPAPGIKPYLERAEAERARITRVFDTHVHADHPSGGRALAGATGAVLHLPARSVTRGLSYADRLEVLEDGGRIPLGVAEVRAIALPGHTTDMTGLLIDGRALVAGDSLFKDSIARPDLEAGDSGAAEAARTLWVTLRDRIGPLGDEVILLPCHYPGGRLDGPIAPTLGTVRQRMPLLEAPQEEFVQQLLSDMPPRPANYLEIIAVNMGEEHPDVLSLEAGGNSCAADSSWGAKDRPG